MSSSPGGTTSGRLMMLFWNEHPWVLVFPMYPSWAEDRGRKRLVPISKVKALKTEQFKVTRRPWPMFLSGLGVLLQSEKSPV